MSEEAVEFVKTGKRKTAVARVRLVPGEGRVTVNKRSLEDYFGRPTSRMIVEQPLVLTETKGRYDVKVNVCGGGISAQAAAIRQWRPWEHATGPRSAQGKARVARNADKGRQRETLRLIARQLRAIRKLGPPQAH